MPGAGPAPANHSKGARRKAGGRQCQAPFGNTGESKATRRYEKCSSDLLQTFSSRLYLILDSNPFGGLDNVSQDHHSQQRFPHLLKRATGLGTIEKLMHHEDQLAVTESGPRAHSYIVSSEAQKTCQFWLLTLWLLTFWLLTVPYPSI